MATKQTTLLLIDMQEGVLNLLSQQSAAGNILVIFVHVGFRKGMPEISSDNKTFFDSTDLIFNNQYFT